MLIETTARAAEATADTAAGADIGAAADTVAGADVVAATDDVAAADLVAARGRADRH